MTATLRPLTEFKHLRHVNYGCLLMVFSHSICDLCGSLYNRWGVLIDFCTFLFISLGDSGSYIIPLF